MPKLLAKRNRFVSMDNEFLTRTDLSLKAKGLLACMMCLPPDWRFSIEGLAYINKRAKVPFHLRYGSWSSLTICDGAIQGQRMEKSQTLFTQFAISQLLNTKRCTAKLMMS